MSVVRTFGTYEVVNAAHMSEISDFILVSTDKAVRSTNIMGATRRAQSIVLLEKLVPEFEHNRDNIEQVAAS